MVLECSICTNFLDDGEFKPVTGTCGHTLCINCCRSIQNRKCPTCQKQNAFRDEIVNFQLIEMINAVKEKEAKQVQKEKAEEENLNRNFCKCSECNSLIRKDQSRLCLPCCETLDFCENALNEELAKVLVFCGSCALEGVHKNHKTVLYNNFKLQQQAVIALGKFVRECESVTTTGCSEEFEKLKSVKTRLMKVLTNITSNVQNIEVAKYNELLKVCENVKNGHQDAIYYLKQQMIESTKTLEDLEARLLATLPDQTTNVQLTERNKKPTIPVSKRFLTLLPNEQMAIGTPAERLILPLWFVFVSRSYVSNNLGLLIKLAEPITHIVMLLIHNLSYDVDVELNVGQFLSPGIYCHSANCRTCYRATVKGCQGKLCQPIQHEGLEGLYPFSKTLKNLPMFQFNGTCQLCECPWEYHAYEKYYFKKDAVSTDLTNSKKEQFNKEKEFLENFIVEANLFGSVFDSPWKTQGPFNAFLDFFKTSFFLSNNEITLLFLHMAHDRIKKTVEKRLMDQDQQGRCSAKTPLGMGRLIKDLGQLEFTGPILAQWNLLNFA